MKNYTLKFLFIFLVAAISTSHATSYIAPDVPSITNELSPSPGREYQLLFAYTNNLLKHEAMNFYANIDPQTGDLDKKHPLVWRRVGANGRILRPKKLQENKVLLLMKYVPKSFEKNQVRFHLNFQLYRPGFPNKDRGMDVTRQFQIKKIQDQYKAFLIQQSEIPHPFDQMHSSIHFRDFGKVLIGDPAGTNAYWTRVTYANGLNEYIVPSSYQQNKKSMPQKSDSSFNFDEGKVRFVDSKGVEIPVGSILRR
ncbi:hypothetical protein ACFLRA_03480 [Bdellovibrionota bacterium]